MSKKQNKNPDQMSFEAMFFEPVKAKKPDIGSADIAVQVREILSDILSDARHNGYDRYDLAANISRLSGRDVSKNMLDRYTAPSAEEWRFPLETLPALCIATGDFSLLDYIAEACGCKVLRGEEAWLAEVGALTIQDQQTRNRLSQIKKNVSPEVLNELLKRLGEKNS